MTRLRQVVVQQGDVERAAEHHDAGRAHGIVQLRVDDVLQRRTGQLDLELARRILSIRAGDRQDARLAWRRAGSSLPLFFSLPMKVKPSGMTIWPVPLRTTSPRVSLTSRIRREPSFADVFRWRPRWCGGRTRRC